MSSPHLMHASVALKWLYELIWTLIIDLEGMVWDFIMTEISPSALAVLPHMPDRITNILTLVTFVSVFSTVWVQFHLQGRVSWPHHGGYCSGHCYGEPRRHRRVGCRKATSVLRVSFYQDPEPAEPAGQRGDGPWELEKWDGDPCG